MAKIEPTTPHSAVDCCDEDEKHYPTTYFSVVPSSVMKGLSVGDEVIVTLKGRIKSISQREDYEDKEKVCGNLDVEYHDFSVKSGKKSEWDEMVDD